MLHRLQGRGPDGEGHYGRQQSCGGKKGGRPAKAISQQEATGTHREHGGPVAEGGSGSTWPPLRLGQEVGAICVDSDVLGGTADGQHQGRDADGGEAGWISAGLQQGHRRNHWHQD